jgi:hypothetical protein
VTFTLCTRIAIEVILRAAPTAAAVVSFVPSQDPSAAVMTSVLAKKCVKVALKTFIDNVSIEVIEDLLIGDAFSFFSPSDVGQMTPNLTSKIAARSLESQALRQQLDQQDDMEE